MKIITNHAQFIPLGGIKVFPTLFCSYGQETKDKHKPSLFCVIFCFFHIIMFSKLYSFLRIFLVLSFLYPFIFYSFMLHYSLSLVPWSLASCKINCDSLVLLILPLKISATWSFPIALGYFSCNWLANIASNLQILKFWSQVWFHKIYFL